MLTLVLICHILLRAQEMTNHPDKFQCKSQGKHCSEHAHQVPLQHMQMLLELGSMESLESRQ